MVEKHSPDMKTSLAGRQRQHERSCWSQDQQRGKFSTFWVIRMRGNSQTNGRKHAPDMKTLLAGRQQQQSIQETNFLSISTITIVRDDCLDEWRDLIKHSTCCDAALL
jgi:hypothetical protein